MCTHEEIVMSNTMSSDSMYRTCSTDSGPRNVEPAMLHRQDSRQCPPEAGMRRPLYRPLLHRKFSFQHCSRGTLYDRVAMGRLLVILLGTILLAAYHDSPPLSKLFVQAEKDSNPYPYGENPNNVFKMYWNDAGNIMQDLSKFSSLYIRYHGCVWSECQVDSFDDDGENRDGDEYWYQYRTQPFCANAAYSLYGTLRNASPLSSVGSFSSCSRGTYINSFFTYGGADTVVDALNLKTGTTTFDSMGYNDGSSNSHPNSVCYVIDEGGNNGGDDGSSSTMGCSADNQFVVAEFGGTTCDGNYFIQTLERLNQYNHAMNSVHCKQIWNYNRHYKNSIAYINDQQSSSGNGRRRSRRRLNNDDQSSSSYSYYSPAEKLLANSWACDISIYPKGCPDPYKLKKKYDTVLKSVAAGRSSRMVVTNARLQRPLSILASITFGIGICFCGVAYIMTNRSRFQKNGVIPVICGDLKMWFVSLCRSIYDSLVWCCAGCWAMVIGIARKTRRMQKKKSRQQRKEERKQEKLLRKKQRKLGSSQSGSMSDTSSNARRQRGLSHVRPASTGRAMSSPRRKLEENEYDDASDSPDRRSSRRSKSSSHRFLSRDRRKPASKYYHGMEEADPKQQRHRGSFAEMNSSNEDSFRSDVV